MEIHIVDMITIWYDEQEVVLNMVCIFLDTKMHR